MKLTAALALAAVLAGTASCAGEQAGYGPTTAGPTITASPSASPPEPLAVEEPAPRRPRPTRRPVTSLCQLFTTAEVTRWLGLPVASGTPNTEGPYRVCSWRALEPPRVPDWRVGDPVLEHDDGIVTITLGRAADYVVLGERVVNLAEGKRASGRQDLPKIGAGAFAVGASVSGVPIWNAVALHEDTVVAVEVSGADSRSSIATVTEFLGQTLDRL